MNPIFYSLFNLMGVYPAIYAALLVPGGRSANGVPAYPFVIGSFFLGAFALLPYMALVRLLTVRIALLCLLPSCCPACWPMLNIWGGGAQRLCSPCCVA